MSELNEIESRLESLYEEYESNNWWMFNRMYLDAADAGVLDYDTSKTNKSKDVIRALDNIATDPFGKKMGTTIDGWKENINFNIAVKPKAQSLFAQFLQIYGSGSGRPFPVALRETALADIEEVITNNRDILIADLVKSFVGQEAAKAMLQGMEIDLQETVELSQVQAKQLIDKMQQAYREKDQESLKKCEKYLIDKLQEGKVKNVVIAVSRDFIDFGVCGVETPVVKTKKRRIYKTVPLNENGRVVYKKMPTFESKSILTCERVKPWNLWLDADADGDTQAGRGVFKIFYCDLSDLKRYRQMPGYDKEKLDKLIKKQKPEAAARDTRSDTPQDEMKSYHTKPLHAYEFYGWLDGEYLIEHGYEDIVEAALDTGYYDEYVFNEETGQEELIKPEKENVAVEVHAIMIEESLVFFSENKLPTCRRPFEWAQSIPEPDTNMGHSIYSLGRPVVQVMNDVVRRAKDNEMLTGNGMFVYNKKYIEPFDGLTPGGSIVLNERALAAQLKVQDVFQQLQFKSTSQGLMNIAAVMDPLLDVATMVPKQLSGIRTAGEKTAFEYNNLMTNAQAVIQGMFSNFDTGIVEPIVESMYHYIQNDDNVPEDLKCSAEVISLGAETYQEKALNRQRLMELLDLMSRMPENVTNTVEYDKVLREILDSMDFDTDKFIVDEMTKSRMQQLEQMVAQLQQQVEATTQQNQQLQQELGKTQQDNQQLETKNFQLGALADEKARRQSAQLQTASVKSDLKLEQMKNKLTTTTKTGEKNDKQEQPTET